MSYFLLIALGLWALYLAFWDPTRTGQQTAGVRSGLPALARGRRIGITALQVMPFLEYIPYSPRAEGGPNTGWAFATTLRVSTGGDLHDDPAGVQWRAGSLLGQQSAQVPHRIRGIPAAGAGRPRARRREPAGDWSWRSRFGALVFLFFRSAGTRRSIAPFFEFLPLLNKIRAMGMVFFLPRSSSRCWRRSGWIAY